MQSRILGWPLLLKRLVVLAGDICLSVIATWLAFTLRLDTPNIPSGGQWIVYGITATLFIPIFIRLGLYRAIFRYTGQSALVATAKAIFIYSLVLTVLLFWGRWEVVPRTLGVLQPLIFLVLVGASRAFARFWLAALSHNGVQQRPRILIFGAGTAGVQTALAIEVSGQYELEGFIDDAPAKIGRTINGVRVHGPADIASLIQKRGVSELLLAMPSATHARRKEIIESLRNLPLHVRTLPDWSDLASGRVTVQDFKELEIEDLLGRDPVAPDSALLARNLRDKVVWVTGAGGSIGSELCRQIVQERPRTLLLLDHNEFGLYSIELELKALVEDGNLNVALVPLLGSVNDAQAMHDIGQAYRPDTLIHAAAYKHVPLVESNPSRGVLNNVFGTLTMAQVARDCGVSHFILISTDKAVRPTNVMGASKRMAELILQALAEQGDGRTCYCMVRFGNVLGSSGSVVPRFRQQLAEGGPITVTHPEVTRYFMTIPEAAQLVLQAGAMAQGGEVFVLDMGEPVKILDLAHRMMELSGLKVRNAANPNGDIEIQITGLRPGEKLYEELLIGDNPIPTTHPRIMMAREHRFPWPELEVQLQALQRAALAQDVQALRAVLGHCVAGFNPTPSAS